MRKKSTSSPFQNIETHFLNVFHAGVYISSQELSDIGKENNLDIPLKNREIVIKNLLNGANEAGSLSTVMLQISALIKARIATLNEFAKQYPLAAPFLQNQIQRSTSTDLLLKQQQRANPYE